MQAFLVSCVVGLSALQYAAASKPQEVNIMVEAPAAGNSWDQLAAMLRTEKSRAASLASTGKASFLGGFPVPVTGNTMKNRLYTTEAMGGSSLSVNIVESATEPVSASVAHSFADADETGPWKRIVIPSHHGFQAKDGKHTVFNVHIPEGQAGFTEEQQKLVATLQQRSSELAELYSKKASFLSQPNIRLRGSEAAQLVGDAVDIANHVMEAPQGQAATPSGDIMGKAAGAANDARAAARAMSFLAKGSEFNRETQSPMIWLNLRGAESKGSFIEAPAGTPPYSVVDIYLEEVPSQ